MTRRFIAPITALMLLVLRPSAGAQTPGEAALKAAFVYNFVKFTEWPAATLAPTASILVCVLDQDVARELESATTGRLVGDHPIVVRRAKPEDALRDCAVLYVSRLDGKRTRQVLTAVRGADVLTISDADAFAEAGGVVGLFLEDGRMRFAVNIEAAERSHLFLSSKLLSLARIVKGPAS